MYCFISAPIEYRTRKAIKRTFSPLSSVKIKGAKAGSAVAKSGRVWYNREDDETEIAEFLAALGLGSTSALLLVLFVPPSLLSILDRFIVKDGATD